jgi:hypothetical protein
LQGFGFDAAKNVGKYAFLQPKTGKFTPHNTLHKNTRKTPKFKLYLFNADLLLVYGWILCVF